VASTAQEAADRLTALAAHGLRDTATDPLGEAWRNGEDVRWPAPTEDVRRVSLPTYPFAGDSHGALTPRNHPAG
jgi:hypothetical protein